MSDISLKLWNSNDHVNVDLMLYPKFPDWRREEMSHNDLRANALYEFELYPTDNVNEARVFIDDRDIGLFERINGKLIFIRKENIINRNNREIHPFQPFLTYFGYVVLRIELTYDDGRTETLFTRYTNVVSNDNTVKNATLEMLERLEEYNNSEFGDLVFNEITGKKNEKYNYWFGSLLPNKGRYIEAYIELLKEILGVYRQNFSVFRVNGYHKIEHRQKVISFEKIKQCTQNEFRWLMQNADRFALVEQNIGIKYQHKNYVPVNILGDEQYKNFGIYENQVVVFFLKTVLKHCTNIRQELEKNYQNFKGHVNFQNYISFSLLTLKNCPKEECVAQLRNLEHEFQMLWIQYKDLWPVQQENILERIPYPTKVFQEVRHYRDVYEEIRRWFDFGEFSLKRYNAMLKIKTIDKLYEYYCLYKLFEMFRNQGWRPRSEEKFAQFINYVNGEHDKEVCNTYCFIKNKKELTFYYEPSYSDWEHSKNGNNGINLFRLFRTNNSTKNYWTPDFVIKVQEDGYERYAVLDAKYSDKNSIQNYSLPDCIDKYIIETSVKYYPYIVQMMVILQGKPSNDGFGNYQDSTIAQGPIVGIMPFYVQSKTDELYEQLKKALAL